MSDWLLYIAAALLVVTGVVHSALGERRLIVPLLSRREGVLASPLARQTTGEIIYVAGGFNILAMPVAAEE